MPDPVFSIIIPSRNSPDVFRRALDTVLAQSFSDIEVIAVIDGARVDDSAAYQAMSDEFSVRNVKFVFLPYRHNGHGPAFARNEGAAVASGHYIGFLDDDDLWTDMEHLARAHDVIADSGNQVDIYFTQQVAQHPDGHLDKMQWLAGFSDRIGKTMSPDQWGAYRVKVDDLAGAGGFCHLNTTLVRLSLFHKLGGFDETLRYEQDRDLFYRIIDAATDIRINSCYVALHYVPEKGAGASASTRVGDLSKKLFQLKLLDKQILFAQHSVIRKICQTHKGYTLKYVAVDLASQGDFRTAGMYARQALAVLFGFKWFAYTVFLTVRGVLR